MTIIHMSEKGQIVVPKAIRDEHGFKNGTAFSVLETKSGAILFRPLKNPPRKDLIEHLSSLKGLEVPERRHHSPPRV